MNCITNTNNISRVDENVKFYSNSLPNIFLEQYVDYNYKTLDKIEAISPNNKFHLEECNLIPRNSAVKCSITTNEYLLSTTKEIKSIDAGYSNVNLSYQTAALSNKNADAGNDTLENSGQIHLASNNESCISGRLEIRVIPTG